MGRGMRWDDKAVVGVKEGEEYVRGRLFLKTLRPPPSLPDLHTALLQTTWLTWQARVLVV